MANFLANENVPLQVVEAIRAEGHDLTWISEFMPGADDQTVLGRSLAEGRVLLTFDKDFGELAFRFGRKSSCGVILLRPKLKSPDWLALSSMCSPNQLIGKITSALLRKATCE